MKKWKNEKSKNRVHKQSKNNEKLKIRIREKWRSDKIKKCKDPNYRKQKKNWLNKEV